MKIFTMFLMCSALCFFTKQYDYVSYVVAAIMMIKGLKSEKLVDVFNGRELNMKTTKNNVFEFLGLLVVLLIFSEFNISSLLVTLFFAIIVYYFGIRNTDEIIFSKRINS